MVQPATRQTSLDDIATPEGTFAVVAMDQRNTLKRMYAAVGIDDPGHDELLGIKADVVSALGGVASAFLLDPTYGMPALGRADRSSGASYGVLVAAESQVRDTYEGEPRASYDPQQNAQWVVDQGGHAVKFLIQVRADRAVAVGALDLTAEAIGVIRTVVDDCRACGVPSVIENLIYPIRGAADLSPGQRTDAIIGAARVLDELEPDLLKLEYPGSPEACRRLAKEIRSPWAVLSAGVAFDEFTRVLAVSCDEGGASGFIAGRAVWRDAVGMAPDARRAYLADEGVRRLEGCVEAISGRARPWTEVRAA